MTKFDIKNYFERIYNVKIDKVNTRIQHGKWLFKLVIKLGKLNTLNC